MASAFQAALDKIEIRVKPADMGTLPMKIFSAWPTRMRKNLQAAGEHAVELLKRRTLAVKAVDLGDMARGWKYKVRSYKDATVYNETPQVVYVEMGRQPGAKQPPTQALVPWVERHFLVTGKSAYAKAYMLARSIKMRGIAPRPIATHEPTRRKISSAFSQVVQNAIKESAK